MTNDRLSQCFPPTIHYNNAPPLEMETGLKTTRVRYGLRSTLYYWLFRRFSVPPQQRLIGGIRWLVSPRFSWSSSLLRTCELYILAKSQFSACSSVLSERRLQVLLRSVSVMCLFDGLFAAMSRKFSVWV